ncbi:hypothetical protein ABDI30_22375 [Paenibacillus cisolokensis]|uniref:hypothetical protein n=1 Tax=Paenibacillus cisolokensis TaxID=1658519 RepID=UPI003D28AD73
MSERILRQMMADSFIFLRGRSILGWACAFYNMVKIIQIDDDRYMLNYKASFRVDLSINDSFKNNRASLKRFI